MESLKKAIVITLGVLALAGFMCFCFYAVLRWADQ